MFVVSGSIKFPSISLVDSVLQMPRKPFCLCAQAHQRALAGSCLFLPAPVFPEIWRKAISFGLYRTHQLLRQETITNRSSIAPHLRVWGTLPSPDARSCGYGTPGYSFWYLLPPRDGPVRDHLRMRSGGGSSIRSAHPLRRSTNACCRRSLRWPWAALGLESSRGFGAEIASLGFVLLRFLTPCAEVTRPLRCVSCFVARSRFE